MAHSPSKRWENGVLVERAIATGVGGEDPDEVELKATRPYKAPIPTRTAGNRKAVQEAENKAVKQASTKSK